MCTDGQSMIQDTRLTLLLLHMPIIVCHIVSLVSVTTGIYKQAITSVGGEGYMWSNGRNPIMARITHPLGRTSSPQHHRFGGAGPAEDTTTCPTMTGQDNVRMDNMHQRDKMCSGWVGDLWSKTGEKRRWNGDEIEIGMLIVVEHPHTDPVSSRPYLTKKIRKKLEWLELTAYGWRNEIYTDIGCSVSRMRLGSSPEDRSSLSPPSVPKTNIMGQYYWPSKNGSNFWTC